MDVSAPPLPLTALVLAIAALRLFELNVSRRRTAALIASGAARVSEPHFRAMVALHGSILAGSLIEASLRADPSPAALTATMVAIVLAANALRLWVITTLGRHWNVQIIASLPLGVVSDGPFRFVRHPNYLAVFVELLALPLVGGAWITAAVGGVLHAWVLYHRIRCEERMLMSHAEYRARMGHKPRFVPGLL
jgi:methyltransferase